MVLRVPCEDFPTALWVIEGTVVWSIRSRFQALYSLIVKELADVCSTLEPVCFAASGVEDAGETPA